MLNMKKGSKVQNADKLNEGYKIEEYGFTANVNVEKIEPILRHFIELHNEPMFFILEIPTNLDDETQARPGVLETTHKDIYYIDGCSKEAVLAILDRDSELLINDGISDFGFGCHESYDEIMVGKYNVLTIYSRTPEAYNGFFEKYGINQVNELVTAWDTFTEEALGVSKRVAVNGQTIYDIPDKYKEWGIYKAEVREE